MTQKTASVRIRIIEKFLKIAINKNLLFKSSSIKINLYAMDVIDNSF